jgi:hypothetical protein
VDVLSGDGGFSLFLNSVQFNFKSNEVFVHLNLLKLVILSPGQEKFQLQRTLLYKFSLLRPMEEILQVPPPQFGREWRKTCGGCVVY